ncbi:hypothetical protein [Corynebacterium marambiense]
MRQYCHCSGYWHATVSDQRAWRR